MALDATGTPTSPDSIPKYNTAVDPPSGKGFNAAMDAIQVALSARVGAPSGIASGEVPVWNGSAWVRSSVTRIGVGSLGSGTPSASTYLRGDGSWAAISTGPGDPVTSLPGSPTDQQQALLVDSLTAPTYAWLFQYEAGISDANKWVFLGGSPLQSEVVAAETTASTSYVDLTTVGPQVTVPRAGIYHIHFGAQMSAAAVTTNYMAIKIGAAATSDTDGITHVVAGAAYSNMGVRTMRRTLAASDLLKCQYKMSTATSGTFLHRFLHVTPVRVA